MAYAKHRIHCGRVVAGLAAAWALFLSTSVRCAGDDFGDAPSAAQSGFANSYPVTLADDGARHLNGLPFLGLLEGGAGVPDGEDDGVPTYGAVGDNLVGLPDEDGVVFGMPVSGLQVSGAISLGATSTLTVVWTTRVGDPPSVVDVWADWNRDGTWADTERILTHEALTTVTTNPPGQPAAGQQAFSIPVPAIASPGLTYLRARISTNGVALPTGYADSGEVEDHAIIVYGREAAEAFSATNQHDLAYRRLLFLPTGFAGDYVVCSGVAGAFATDPETGTVLTNLADEALVQITPTNGPITFAGVSYSNLHVSSNGHISFDGGANPSAPTLSAHYGAARISALLCNLDPAQGGTVSWQDLSNRVVVTYAGVPVHNGGGINSVQVEIYRDGNVAITTLRVDAPAAVVGISRGTETSPYSSVDLSAQIDAIRMHRPDLTTLVALGQGAELFDGATPDLAHRTLIFQPLTPETFVQHEAFHGFDGYTCMIAPNAGWPYGGASASTEVTNLVPLLSGGSVNLDDILPGSAAYSFFGAPYTGIFINRNGSITFGFADSGLAPSLEHHFVQPRISALLAGFTPADVDVWLYARPSGLQSSSTDVLGIAFHQTSSEDPAAVNTAWVEFLDAGRITIGFGCLSASNLVVGLSPPGAQATHHALADLSAVYPRSQTPRNIFVDQSATALPLGGSWESAFTRLEDALAIAGFGDVIHMAEGVYAPVDTANRVGQLSYPESDMFCGFGHAFPVLTSLAIAGGYPSGGGERDPYRHRTVLSGDMGRDDLNADGNGIAESIADHAGTNAPTVVRVVGNAPTTPWIPAALTMPTVILDGITVTAASRGHGLDVQDARVAMTDSTFQGNLGTVGPALHASGAETEVVALRSTFAGNYGVEGGAIACRGGALDLTLCSLSGNTALYKGGALESAGARVTLTKCTVTGNEAGHNGGGGIVHKAGTLRLDNNIIAGNVAGTGPDISAEVASIVTLNANLIGNNDTVTNLFDSSDPLVGAPGHELDPLLSDLAYFGGATETHMPSLDSPAIDAAVTNGVFDDYLFDVVLNYADTAEALDQRGRPAFMDGDVPLDGPAYDLGSTELSVAIVTTLDDENDGPTNGFLSLREAIAITHPPADIVAITNAPLGDSASAMAHLEHGEIVIPRSMGIFYLGSETTPLVLRPRFLSDPGRAFRVSDGVPEVRRFVVMQGLRFQSFGFGESHGGAIDSEEDLILYRSTFENCTVRADTNAPPAAQTARGGAIASRGGDLFLLECLLTTNSARSAHGAAYGGAIASQSGTVFLVDCDVSDNRVDAGTLGDLSDLTAAYGGGVYNDSDQMVMLGCSVRGNTAFGHGFVHIGTNPPLASITAGGGVASPRGLTYVVGSTFARNRCQHLYNAEAFSNAAPHAARAGGGGIYAYQLALFDSTVVANVCNTVGGGGGSFALQTLLLNSIVASNAAAPVAVGSTNQTVGPSRGPDVGILDFGFTNYLPIVVYGANLIGNNSGVSNFFPAGALVGTEAAPKNPGLAPLGRYAASRLTHAMPVPPGSPAYAQGVLVPDYEHSDQYGRPRPVTANVKGGAIDIGAVETVGAIDVIGEAEGGASEDSVVDHRARTGPVRPDASAAEVDSDGDGMSDLDELEALTGVFDAEDVLKLRIAPVAATATQSVELAWNAVNGVRYRLDAIADLSPLATNAPLPLLELDGNNATNAFLVPLDGPRRFFRLHARNTLIEALDDLSLAERQARALQIFAENISQISTEP